MRTMCKVRGARLICSKYSGGRCWRHGRNCSADALNHLEALLPGRPHATQHNPRVVQGSGSASLQCGAHYGAAGHGEWHSGRSGVPEFPSHQRAEDPVRLRCGHHLRPPDSCVRNCHAGNPVLAKPPASHSVPTNPRRRSPVPAIPPTQSLREKSTGRCWAASIIRGDSCAPSTTRPLYTGKRGGEFRPVLAQTRPAGLLVPKTLHLVAPPGNLIWRTANRKLSMIW